MAASAPLPPASSGEDGRDGSTAAMSDWAFTVSADCASFVENYDPGQAVLGPDGGGGDGAWAEYVWSPEVVSVQITVGKNCGDREHAVADEVINSMLATLYEDQAEEGRCQITLGLKPVYGRQLMEHRRGNRRHATVVSSESLERLVIHICGDLLGYGAAAVVAALGSAGASAGVDAGSDAVGERAWGERLKVFSNNFRFAERVTALLQQGGAQLLVALEGDAARQPYYREGNGLNVGLFGSVDLVRVLAPLARATSFNAPPAAREELRRAVAVREEMGAAMRRLVVEDSLKLAIMEVLFNGLDSLHRRIVVWGHARVEDTLAGWWDYCWHDLRAADRDSWRALGWDYRSWPPKPVAAAAPSDSRGRWQPTARAAGPAFCPSAQKRAWAELTEAQQAAAGALNVAAPLRPDMWAACQGGLGGAGSFRLWWVMGLVALMLVLSVAAGAWLAHRVVAEARPTASTGLHARGFRAGGRAGGDVPLPASVNPFKVDPLAKVAKVE